MSRETTSKTAVRVLLVASDQSTLAWMAASLEPGGWSLDLRTASASSALAGAFAKSIPDVALVGTLAGRCPAEVFRNLLPAQCPCPVILVDPLAPIQSGEDIVRGRAWDIVSPDDADRLLVSFSHALSHVRAGRRHHQVRSRLGERDKSLRAITSHVPGMVFRLQVRADSLRFHYVSDGVASLLGCTAEQILEDPGWLFTRIADWDRQSLEGLLARTLDGLARLDWTGALDCEGQARWLNIKANAIREEGTVEIDGVAIDVTECRETEQRLMATLFELESQSGRLQEVREEERERITREIHDELGSLMTAIKLELFTQRRWVESHIGRPEWAGPLSRGLSALADRIDTAIETVRRIARELRPRILDDLGAALAIQWYVEEFARSAGLEALVEVDPEMPPLERAMDTALFRIVQEGLTNVVRHAGARLVHVTLHRTGDELVFELGDDGTGFDPEAVTAPQSTGLMGMRERARRLGGTFDIDRSIHRGALLRVVFPLGRRVS
ncbi:MAG: PAS domain-containing sensor histidine kinase [Halothiobacillaceae bacterium]